MRLDEKGLAPCPFCGGEAEIVHVEEGENEGGSYVCCTRCLASGNVEFEFKENFISNWNRRATPTPATVSEEAERKFKRGDRVTKTKGSSWTGRVVGFYSTDLTPIGYCVESENEPGSVQIYPESALETALASIPPKPAQDRWPAPGDKMRFLNRNGYDTELEAARKVFNTSDTYTVRSFDLGGFSSLITFQGISGWWNSVMFDFDERETALAAGGRG